MDTSRGSHGAHHGSDAVPSPSLSRLEEAMGALLGMAQQQQAQIAQLAQLMQQQLHSQQELQRSVNDFLLDRVATAAVANASVAATTAPVRSQLEHLRHAHTVAQRTLDDRHPAPTFAHGDVAAAREDGLMATGAAQRVDGDASFDGLTSQRIPLQPAGPQARRYFAAGGSVGTRSGSGSASQAERSAVSTVGSSSVPGAVPLVRPLSAGGTPPSHRAVVALTPPHAAAQDAHGSHNVSGVSSTAARVASARMQSWEPWVPPPGANSHLGSPAKDAPAGPGESPNTTLTSQSGTSASENAVLAPTRDAMVRVSGGGSAGSQHSASLPMLLNPLGSPPPLLHRPAATTAPSPHHHAVEANTQPSPVPTRIDEEPVIERVEEAAAEALRTHSVGADRYNATREVYDEMGCSPQQQPAPHARHVPHQHRLAGGDISAEPPQPPVHASVSPVVVPRGHSAASTQAAARSPEANFRLWAGLDSPQPQPGDWDAGQHVPIRRELPPATAHTAPVAVHPDTASYPASTTDTVPVVSGLRHRSHSRGSSREGEGRHRSHSAHRDASLPRADLLRYDPDRAARRAASDMRRVVRLEGAEEEDSSAVPSGPSDDDGFAGRHLLYKAGGHFGGHHAAPAASHDHATRSQHHHAQPTWAAAPVAKKGVPTTLDPGFLSDASYESRQYMRSIGINL